MTDWPDGKIVKPAAFSEEDMFVVSKADTLCVWTGSKIMYSGAEHLAPQQASGYNFQSGESDIEPYNVLSGTGRIRIPEMGQLHKIFVFPKDPKWIVGAAYYPELTLGTGSGQPYGWGGCSGKMALLKWVNNYSNCTYLSGELYFNSGVVDVIAFGSIY